MTSRDTDKPASARLARALNVALVCMAVGSHLLYNSAKLTISWSQYSQPYVMAGVWLAVTVICVVAAVLLLTDRSRTALARCLAALSVALGSVAAAVCPPGEAIGDANWAWNAVSLTGVLLLLHRPLRELALMLGAHAFLTGAALLADDAVDRMSAVRFLTVVCTTMGTWLLVALISHALRRTAQQVAAAAEARAQSLGALRAAQEVHSERRRRYAFLHAHAMPLLQALGEGRADPADAGVRRRAAIEASRLRRLLAETDDVPHPLLHELRACADIAERRQVDVSLVVVGQLPALLPALRRELTAGPLLALASATSRARVTVVASSDDVAVSVLADSPEDLGVTEPSHQSLSLTCAYVEDSLWLETRWQNPSPSA